MPQKNVGFVLKKFFPSKQKFSVLTANNGKVGLVIKNTKICHRIWPGMHISFTSTQENNMTYTNNNVEIINTVLTQTKEDLNWLHHLLELHYYFIPPQMPCSETFNFLKIYLSFLNHKYLLPGETKAIKKICLLHFLTKTGFYSKKNVLKYSVFFENNITLFYDQPEKQAVANLRINLNQISNSEVKKMNGWIFDCLKIHPQFNSFKTVRFIYQA